MYTLADVLHQSPIIYFTGQFIALFKAWFPLNVSVVATNRSCLLVRTLLHFAGFNRQTSLGLLPSLLYLEACRSRSTSRIWLEMTTFRKSL